MMRNIGVLSEGEHFRFKGFDWIVLDRDVDGGVLVIKSSPWKKCCFDNNYDNYAISSLRKDLLCEFPNILCEDNLIPHVVDLSTNKKENYYGNVIDSVFILSLYECCKYHKNIPLFSDWMWTCTPLQISNVKSGCLVMCRGGFGELFYNVVDSELAVVPACVFKKCVQCC